jgi:hypothetical protein
LFVVLTKIICIISDSLLKMRKSVAPILSFQRKITPTENEKFQTY